jgi:hypothetical protein
MRGAARRKGLTMQRTKKQRVALAVAAHDQAQRHLVMAHKTLTTIACLLFDEMPKKDGDYEQPVVEVVDQMQREFAARMAEHMLDQSPADVVAIAAAMIRYAASASQEAVIAACRDEQGERGRGVIEDLLREVSDGRADGDIPSA